MTPGVGKRGVSAKARTERSVPPADVGDVLRDLDTQLLIQARAGDREAAAGLIRRNSARIERYIARMVGRRGPAEDLTQDVFVRALSPQSRYKPVAKASTWLYRVATNAALNYIKKKRDERVGPDPPDGPREPADRRASPPDQQMTVDEFQRRVALVVQSLPAKQRAAITLFAREKCTYEQIAEVLGVSLDAVKSLIARARATLRAELDELT